VTGDYNDVPYPVPCELGQDVVYQTSESLETDADTPREVPGSAADAIPDGRSDERPSSLGYLPYDILALKRVRAQGQMVAVLLDYAQREYHDGITVNSLLELLGGKII
jgi:hypothetical protein